MRRSYLVGPFICCLAIWTVGNGTLPLLPLYAMELGASRETSGFFLSFAFLCLALGNGAPAILPKNFRKQRILVLAAALPIAVSAWLAGRVTSVLELAVVIGASWFCAGVIFSQTATMVGFVAAEKDRGTAFGILGVTNGLGGLLGGLSMGYIADHLGFVWVFNILAGFSLLILVGGLLSPDSPSVVEPQEGTSARVGGAVGLSLGLVFLFVAMLLTSFANATGNLGRSFLMAEERFSKSAIMLTAAVQGLAGIVLPFLMGRLADRIGRRRAMIASVAITAASLVLLGLSYQEWQFFLFAALFGFLAVATAMAPAYVVDVAPRNVGRNVSLVQSAFWVGSIVGMAATGVLATGLGTSKTILLSCAFPAAAAFLIRFGHVKRIRKEPGGSTE